VRLSTQQYFALCASGAIAVFVIVFFFTPSGPIRGPVSEGSEESASGEPEAVANTWLSLIDGKDYRTAWEEAAKSTRREFSMDVFSRLYVEQVQPLGSVRRRTLLGAASATSLPNGQKGNFRLFKYRTSYENDEGRSRDETVTLKAENGVWKVTNHDVCLHTVR